VIRRVRLENWRAYRQLDLPVHPGVTFLVAANGVGKSSLLEAVRWALSPGVVRGDPTVIRHGHDEATATVTLLADQGELEVRRVMSVRGNRGLSSFDATLNGRKLHESDFGRLLAEAWSADLAFVSKTAFLTENLRVEEDEPDLRAHLCQVYSLDKLQRALAEIGPALSQASREVKAARAELTATAEQLQAARQERARLHERLEAARSEVSAARERQAKAQRGAEQALAAQRLSAAATAWDEQSAALRHDVEQAAGPPGDKASPQEALRRAKLSVRQAVEAARTEQARLAARLESVEEALANLRAAGAQCPVCLRALDGRSRERAEHLHAEGLTEVRERLQAVDPRPLVERLHRIEALELRVAALGERPAPEGAVNLDAVNAEVVTAQADLERAVGTLRELEVAARSADQNIDQIVAGLAETEHLRRRYREVALFEAAEKALNSTIGSVLGEQLGPLASEVNRRWQSVFPDRPNLKLMPDGTMSRDAGGSPLAFTAFSAGEKMVARLMMRLTTLLVTTNVPFCWVDEPLEHLDPRSRHLVGSMLAHLSTTPGLEQIFVTTYEEPLARRLAEFQPGRVRVEYLRAEHVS
jgi:chromosome segregation ATPase